MQSDPSGLTLNAFRTLEKPAETEIIIKNSRFIGCASPAQDEEAALSYLRGVKAAHPLASHHCYAYVLGANAAATRFSDDGEPSGTAGKPILEVMKNQELTNACVVVVRYFGGTLLGRGGLVRAYAGACAAAVTLAGIATEEASAILHAQLPYALWDKVQFVMRSLPVRPSDAAYATQVSFRFLVRMRDLDTVRTALSDATEGRIAMELEERLFAQWPADQST